MLERKRAALRRALKSEYIKKMYNPKSYTKDGYIELHDAAMMRFHAMHKTVPDFWFPSWRSFALFSVITLLPIFGHCRNSREVHQAVLIPVPKAAS